MGDIQMGDSLTAENIFASLSPKQRKALEIMFHISDKESTKLAATGADKLQKWPEWNGEPSSFLLYFYYLKGKIEADRNKIGNNTAICNQIIGTISEDKQQ